MNVKETLKRLHKKFPMMGLDELFDVLDCYVEESTLSVTPTWEPAKIWCSTNTSETPKINSITSKNADPLIYTVANNCVDGKIKYYDGEGSVQLTADH